ncbi:hypothetical protein ACLK1T_17725 [Escherichia coli]
MIPIHRQPGSWSWNVMSDNTLRVCHSNGVEKVLAGETSLDEVLRVTVEA